MKNNKSRRAAMSTIASCLVFVASWLPTAVNAAASSDELQTIKAPITANEGVMTLRVVRNRPSGGIFEKVGSLKLKNMDTGKGYELRDQAPTFFSESVYAYALPPGRYEIRSFENFAVGYQFTVQNLPVDSASEQFRIVKGQMTDLGTIAYIREFYPFGTRRFRLAFEPKELAGVRSKEWFDPSLQRAAEAGVLTWEPAEDPAVRPPLVDDLRHLTMDLNGRAMMADKTLLFGESFGQIAARSPSGSWSYYTLPTLGLIRAVAVAADGTIAAGSEEGEVWIHAKGSVGWRALPLPRADVAVQYLAYDDAQRLIAVAEAPQGFKVFAIGDPEKTWDEVAGFQLAETPKAERFTDARLFGDQLRITTKSLAFFREAAVHTISLTQRTVSSMPTKGLMVDIMPDGTLFSMAGMNIAQTFEVSNDGGATWETRASPNFAANPAFKTADEAYLIRLEHLAFNNP